MSGNIPLGRSLFFTYSVLLHISIFGLRVEYLMPPEKIPNHEIWHTITIIYFREYFTLPIVVTFDHQFNHTAISITHLFIYQSAIERIWSLCLGSYGITKRDIYFICIKNLRHQSFAPCSTYGSPSSFKIQFINDTMMFALFFDKQVNHLKCATNEKAILLSEVSHFKPQDRT